MLTRSKAPTALLNTLLCRGCSESIILYYIIIWHKYAYMPIYIYIYIICDNVGNPSAEGRWVALMHILYIYIYIIYIYIYILSLFKSVNEHK